MYITRVVTAPTVEPITLAEAKSQLRISNTDHDLQIIRKIKAIRQYFEEILNRAIVTQTRAVHYRSWPGSGEFEIPYPAIQSVTHLKYTDVDDTEYTLSTSEYSVDTYSEPGRLILEYGETWPSETLQNEDYPIVITYVCGYSPSTDSPPDYRENIPESIIEAMMLGIETLYDKPIESYWNQLDNSIDTLLAPYKVWNF